MNKTTNNSNNSHPLFTLVMIVDRTEVLLIYANNAIYGSTLQSVNWKCVKDSRITQPIAHELSA